MWPRAAASRAFSNVRLAMARRSAVWEARKAGSSRLLMAATPRMPQRSFGLCMAGRGSVGRSGDEIRVRRCVPSRNPAGGEPATVDQLLSFRTRRASDSVYLSTVAGFRVGGGRPPPPQEPRPPSTKWVLGDLTDVRVPHRAASGKVARLPLPPSGNLANPGASADRRQEPNGQERQIATFPSGALGPRPVGRGAVPDLQRPTEPTYHAGMLRELSVQNLAVIEDVRVELEPGFCAWTGETGAGKSLLLGAIGLLLGERGSAELIRAGQEELRVTGRFELTRPGQRTAAEELLQGPLEDDELVLTRRLARSGRSSALVNEQPVSVGTLRRLGEMLVDVHGQRENYSLLQPAYQLQLLDAFGRLGDLRAAYGTAADEVRQLRRRHRELSEARQNRQRELALLRFEREELDAAALREGEFEAIRKEREKLLHAQALAAYTGSVADRLVDDEDSVAAVLGRLIKEAGKWAGLDRKLAEVAQRLTAL